MQTTSSQYDILSRGSVRPLSWGLRVSFDKDFDPSIGFFTLDTSVLDGLDVLSPDGTPDILPWDQYEYQNYDERVMSMEWQREELVPYSVTQAIADLKLNNFDGYFTRGANSPIEPYLLPRRPVRILAGFNGLNVPQFVGLTTETPNADRQSREADVHCVDFLSYLFEKPIDETVVYENLKTGEILDNLFQLMGLIPSQYSIDMSFNEVAFFYVEKGEKFGDVVKKLMEAELGSLFMSETGVLTFRNRVRNTSMPVMYFDSDNIIDYTIPDEDTIINVVEVKANVREVQDRQVIFTLSEKPILSGASTSLFFNFENPVTTLDVVEFFTANANEDGSGTNLTANITVTDVDLFSTAAKVTFANSGADAYLTALTLYGTPAKVTRKIYLRVQDDDSVEQFEEKPLVIENDYIQSDNAANSLALSLLNYYKDYANSIELQVQGNYALQVGDNISVAVDNINSNYRITKIVNILAGALFTQKITAKIYNIPEFFILDVSVLDGDDVLGI